MRLDREHARLVNPNILANRQAEVSPIFTDLIANVISHRIPTFIISPHLDDGVLSAGELVARFTEEKVPVSAVTVFTEGGSGPYLRGTRRYIQASGHASAEEHFAVRKEEDIAAWKALGVTDMQHLGFTDGGYRLSQHPLRRLFGQLVPDIKYVYPLGVGRRSVAKEDSFLQEEVSRRLLSVIPEDSPVLIASPAGIGRHVDHKITKNAVKKVRDQRSMATVIYYEEFPYNTWETTSLQDRDLIRTNLPNQISGQAATSKLNAVFKYPSQIQAMFGGMVPIIREAYYVTGNR